MRTNIDIDDGLMVAAMKAGGFKTKKETVEAGLRLLTRKQVYDELRRSRGQIPWEGDLASMRTGRFADHWE